MQNLDSGTDGPVLNAFRKATRFPLVLIMAPSFAAAKSPGSEIHDAAKAGDAKKVQMLLDGDPGLVWARDESGRTPPLVAAYWSSPEPSESSPYLSEVGEYTEKLRAQSMMQVEVAECLLAAKADVGAREK
jgi:hypothetical protein